MTWDKVKGLKEKQGALRAEAEGMLQKAGDEGRALTAEEKTRFDAIETEHKGLQDVIDRADRFGPVPEDRAIGRDSQPGTGADETSIVNRIVIPAKAKFRHQKIKNFAGPKAEEGAFLAGQFYAATLFGHPAAQEWCKAHGIDARFRNAASEGSNAAGGYLVPTELEQVIIDLREQFGVLRQNARVVNMGSDTKNVPVRKAGLTSYWGSENAEMTNESQKTWDNVALVAKKLYCLTRYSNELSEDAIISIGDDLTGEIAAAFAYSEDLAGFVGDGTGTFGSVTGVVNAVLAGAIVTAASGNTGFETLDLTDFEACIGKLPEFAGIAPKWYVSKPGYAASMMRLVDAAGGNTNATLGAGPTREFLGYPVVFTQVLNKTLGADASKPKVVFGDLRQGVVLGNRRGLTIMLSDQRYFEYDQIGVRGTERVDIQVNGTGTATECGPIVVLKTPAQ